MKEEIVDEELKVSAEDELDDDDVETVEVADELDEADGLGHVQACIASLLNHISPTGACAADTEICEDTQVAPTELRVAPTPMISSAQWHRLPSVGYVKELYP